MSSVGYVESLVIKQERLVSMIFFVPSGNQLTDNSIALSCCPPGDPSA